MKKSIFSLIALAAASLLSATIFSSCQEPEEGISVTFPEKITVSVAAGESYSFDIKADTDWRLSIPTESALYFSFPDQRYTLYGDAGTHEVTVNTTSTNPFATVVCPITMEMGEEKQVIAEITRLGSERSVKIYQAAWNQEDEAFETNEEGDWVYETTPIEELSFRIYNGNPVQRLKVESNVAWSLSQVPEWMNSNKSSGKVGSTEIFIRVRSNALPLEDNTYTLNFNTSADEDGDGTPETITVATLTSAMEGCGNTCNVSFAEEITFNRKGLTYSPITSSYQKSIKGTVSSAKGAELFLLGINSDGGYTTDCSWLTMTVGEYDTNATDVGLWEREVELSAVENQGKERKAVIVALSRNEAANVTSAEDLLEGTSLKEQWADNIATTITQEPSANASEAIMVYDDNVMLNSYAKFEKLSDNTTHPWSLWTDVENAFKLTYRDIYSGDDLVFNKPFVRYEIYGYDSQTQYTDLDNCWIELRQSNAEENIEDGYIIDMRLGEDNGNGGTYTNTLAGENGENEATIVFYDANDEAYTLIHFVADPAFTPFSVAGDIQFADPVAAARAGASLVEITSSDDERYDKEMAANGTKQYYLYTNPDYTSFTLNISASCAFCWAYGSYIEADYDDEAMVMESVDLTITAEESFSSNISFYTDYSSSTIAIQLTIIYTVEQEEE